MIGSDAQPHGCFVCPLIPGEGFGTGFVGLEVSFNSETSSQASECPCGVSGTQEGNFFHVKSLGLKEPQAFVVYSYSAVRNSLK